MTSGVPPELRVRHRLDPMWCQHESKPVPYDVREHVAPCAECEATTHARCICPSRRTPVGEGH